MFQWTHACVLENPLQIMARDKAIVLEITMVVDAIRDPRDQAPEAAAHGSRGVLNSGVPRIKKDRNFVVSAPFRTAAA